MYMQLSWYTVLIAVEQGSIKGPRNKVSGVTDEIDINSGFRMLLFPFIHSGYFYSASSSPLPLRGAPDYNTDTVSEFHAKAYQATAREGLAQGFYVT